VFLEQVDRVGGRGRSPHRVDELVPAERPVGVQQQGGQHQPLLAATQIEGRAAAPRAQRSQDLEPHVRVDTTAHRYLPVQAVLQHVFERVDAPSLSYRRPDGRWSTVDITRAGSG
jgi:hypothetical protein